MVTALFIGLGAFFMALLWASHAQNKELKALEEIGKSLKKANRRDERSQARAEAALNKLRRVK